jgi:hypothetical protein
MSIRSESGWLAACRFAYLVIGTAFASAVVALPAAARNLPALTSQRAAAVTPLPVAGLTPQPAGELPAGGVDISTVSNGCGGGHWTVVPLQNMIGNSSVYRDSNNPLGKRYSVDFKAACDLHDAGYTGAKVWDAVNGRWIDYFGWTREEVDRKFFEDMRKLCAAQIPADAPVALADCKGRGGKTSFGAETRYNFVRDHGLGYRTRPNLNGEWRLGGNCLGASDLRVTQHGRLVTASWKFSDQPPPLGSGVTSVHHFSGLLVTHDPPENDVVIGSETVRPRSGAATSGPMRLILNGETMDQFEMTVNASGSTVPVLRDSKRSTQTSNKSCPKPPPTPATSTQTSSGAASFVLTSTKVTNPNTPELTINAAGGTAVDDHTGPNGGEGKGGEWRVTYTFKVPQSLTPGKAASVSLSLKAEMVKPEQPLFIQMTVRAPDFAQPLSINYPNPSQAAKTFTIPISASYKDAKDLYIVVGVVSAEITYIYHRSGA